MLKYSDSQVFSPPIEAVLSTGEIRAYDAILSDTLLPQTLSLSSTSVFVIGAGLSGLAAARELKKAGINVTILEATSRVGSRCHTTSSPIFSKGVLAEAGGMKFPDTHKVIMEYIGEKRDTNLLIIMYEFYILTLNICILLFVKLTTEILSLPTISFSTMKGEVFS